MQTLRTTKRAALYLVISGAIFLFSPACGTEKVVVKEVKVPCKTPGEGPVVVDVGLSDADRELYYTKAEGSELFPYKLFLHLNNLGDKKTKGLFKENLERFGMVYDDQISERGLPVGMTVQMSKDTEHFNLEMVGVNCAMCHVSEWTHNGTAYRVDGGPSMVDMQLFYSDMLKSIVGTFINPAELWSFLRRYNAEGRASGASSGGASPPTLKQLHSHDSLKAMNEKGGFEKALAAELFKAHAEEMAKEAPKEEEFQQVSSDDDGKKESDSTPEPVPPPKPILRDYSRFKTLTPAARSSSAASGDVVAKQTVEDFLEMMRLLRARATFFTRLITRNNGTVPGNGRVDAFGAARNLLFDTDVQKPTAPVSWPHLWEIDKLEWLHWDANTNSITERNIGQALGLGAVFETKNFTSTIDAKNLCALEKVAKKMKAPKWPAAFGTLDEVKSAKGKAVFAKHCLSCHEHANIDTPLAAIGTNPNRANNFANDVGGVPFPEAIAPLLSKLKAQAFADAKMTPEEIADCEMVKPVWRGPRRYAGRVLAGIWASPPYLHNGSVPTLYDLLLPLSERPSQFFVGRDYDSVKVGIKTSGLPGSFLYEVAKEGNDTRGHTYGTQPVSEGGMSEDERLELLEYLKSL
ncbi:MAG: cytochrome c [Deltaproteobacteria bacterium]|nr:cytochrome c [Deltaproteobacteria bacterium]